jgi:hypothetical protein
MFFPSTVTLNPYISEDSHHHYTYGTPTTPNCRYAKNNQTVKDSNGEDLPSIAWVQFPNGIQVKEKDQIVLPDGTKAPVILAIHVNTPFEIPVCIEVYLGVGES